jgi:serine/threonine protein kinase
MGSICSSHPKTIDSKMTSKKDVKNKLLPPITQIQPKTEINNININISITERQVEKVTPTYKTSPEYIKGQCIGTGNIGSVYSGLSLNTGEIVAIKSIRLNSQKQVEAIENAVKKFSELKHQNIIKYLSTQLSNDEEIDIILEYCNGGSIKQLLEKFDAFDEKLIKLYVKQILEGLVYLHDLGIIHRNIKNCNVLVDGDGTVKLTDFVISDILVGEDPESILYFNTSKTEGPFWMAPEIASKSNNITSAVDIWSVGCIIIEMATKNPPWSNVAKTYEEVYELITTSTGIILLM